MALDTFEERQAYIEQCERQIRDAEVQAYRSRLKWEEFELQMQVWHLTYELWVYTELAPLIYRGMFDPTFCCPVDGEGNAKV